MKNLFPAKDKLWSVAYAMTIMLPFGLIFSRAVMEISCITIGVSFLWHSYKTKSWQWTKETSIRIGLIAWAWLLLVVSPFAVYPETSFLISAAWIRYLLMYAALRNWVLTDKENLFALSKIFAFMLVFVVIDTLWQYATGTSLTGHARDESGRLTGPLDNVKVGIFTAKMLFPITGIFVAYSLETKHRWRKFSGFALLLSCIAIIILSGERTAFGSIIIAISATTFLLAIAEKKLRKILVTSFIAFLAFVGVLFSTQDWVKERAAEAYNVISHYQKSEYGQLHEAGIIVGKEHFLTGAGIRSFRDLCPKLVIDGKVTTDNLHPHNIYIEWFAETGAFGVGIFCLFVFILFQQTYKKFLNHQGNPRLITAFVFACLIVNYFPFMPTQSSVINWSAILLWYSVSLAMASLNILENPENKQ